MIEIDNPKDFFELQSSIPRIPFTQSKGWHDYLNFRGDKIRYFVNDPSDVKIAVWGKEKIISLFKMKFFIVEGESMLSNLEETYISSFYNSFKLCGYNAILINSNNQYFVDYEIGLRRAGFIRPLGFFSCPLTIIVKPQGTITYNRNWKRNFKKSIAANLKFIEINLPSRKEIEVFVSMFKEMSSLKGLSYDLSVEPLKELLADPKMRLFVVNQNQKPIAARIIYFNEKFAEDVYAANSLDARNNGASYFIMQNIFEVLNNEGIEEFDFGRIPPSDHATDNVYVFKKASGGDPIQYNGEWVYFKSKPTEVLFTLYQLFKLKRQRY